MGGFYVWLRLPEQVNAVTLFTEALQRGIAVAPSHVFYPDGLHENAVRLSFARYNADTLRYAAKRLADLVHHMMR
ncbi:MAG: hypothetical protein HND48_13620 [Chloroflexi bacterium]|nr:hypothetical protein [Chloroflexota bacterium]